jgi:hypothetical protein
MKTLPKILALALILLSGAAKADSAVGNAIVGCGMMGVATVGAGAMTAVATRGRNLKGAEIVIHAGVGCVGGTVLGAVAANAAEAPSETELKSEDLKTLQDAKDLDNE